MKSGFSYSSRFLIGRSFLTIFLTIFLTAACSPQPVVRQFKPANQDFGPVRTDGDLNVDAISINSLPT
ncbi:MAG: hypothetical protein U1E10_12875, partial [Bdellovibrionales bacterium]|nr:hypothetical protein [Bdellovibrionales bacterium]